MQVSQAVQQQPRPHCAEDLELGLCVQRGEASPARAPARSRVAAEAQNCCRIIFRFRSWLNLFIRKSSLS